jgi:DNA-binding MarR family transcriptional regulator
MDPLKRQTTSQSTERLLNAFELLRLMDREIPGQVVSAFLYIASHNPCHKQALEEDLGFKVASGSRTTDWLSEYHRLGKPGLGLIKKYQDPLNRRRVLLELTPKGEALIRQMKALISDD